MHDEPSGEAHRDDPLGDTGFQDELDELMFPEPGSAEFTSIERFASSLERIDTTGAVASWLAVAGVDPTEDPELSSLLGTANALRGSLEAATDERAFRSFHHRSRAAIVHLLEQDLTPPEARPGVGAKILNFRRHAVFAPLAAGVAAASIGAIAIFGGLVPGLAEPADEAMVTNLTPRSTNQELVRISLAVNTIREHSERGEAVPAPLLREVAESTARVASLIEQASADLDEAAVTNYTKTIESSRQVLENARTTPDDEGALASANLAVREGAAVASRYLDSLEGAGDPLDEETPTATPTETATPEPTPTSEPTPVPTPVHEPEPTGTATPVHEPPPDPTPTPDPDEDGEAE